MKLRLIPLLFCLLFQATNGDQTKKQGVLAILGVEGSLQRHLSSRNHSLEKVVSDYLSVLEDAVEKADAQSVAVLKSEINSIEQFSADLEKTDDLLKSLRVSPLPPLSKSATSQLKQLCGIWDTQSNLALDQADEKLITTLGLYHEVAEKNGTTADAKLLTKFISDLNNKNVPDTKPITPPKAPKVRPDRTEEDGYIVLYLSEAEQKISGNEPTPENPFYWVDGGDHPEILGLDFEDDRLGNSENQLIECFLVVEIPYKTNSHSDGRFAIEFSNREIGEMVKPRRGSIVKAPLEVKRLLKHSRFDIEITTRSSDGLRIHAAGPKRPRLHLRFEK